MNHSITHRFSPAFRRLGALGVALAMTSGCAFIESATEQTIGAEYVPPVSQEITWPSVDELTGMTEDQIAQLADQGFPSSLAQGTFAHLQGALKLSGQCQLTQSLNDAFAADPNNPMKALDIDVVSCTDESCTDVEVCQDFRGMSFTANVTLELFDEAQASELQETLEIVPQEALVQLRFLVSKLNFFRNTCENDSHCGAGYVCCGGDTMRANQCTLEGLCDPTGCGSDSDCGSDEQCCGSGECAPVGVRQTPNPDGTFTDLTCSNITTRGSIHSSLDDFSLRLGMDDDPMVLVIDQPYLDMIAASPQRFDVDIESAFTKKLKNKLFPCDPADPPEGLDTCPPFSPPQITVSLSMRIAQKDLYQVSFEGAGLELTIQPEIVVSALAVVEGVVADQL